MNFAAIIVLGYGLFDQLTRPCLDSILPSAMALGVPVIVVDNASPDDSASKLQIYARENPYINISLNSENLGFAGGMNQGVALSQSEWVILVNSDTLFSPNALKRLLLAFENSPPEIGLVGPLTNAAGNGQNFLVAGDSPASIIDNAEQLLADQTKLLIPCYRADFFCVGIRRSLWNQLNGLDTIFGKGYYEDFDFSMRAADHGVRSAICEDAFVYHFGSSSFKRSPEQKKLIRRNKNIFIRRHPEARMPHRRDDNFEILLEYNRLLNAGCWSSALENRKQIRLAMLKTDAPKGLIKRFQWFFKTRDLLV